jgi:FkbM family methyltransferase
MYDLLSRLLPEKSGAFLDVGVNLGQTLLALKACEPRRRYIGLEPNSQCVAYVESLIELNRLTDCQIIPVGLGGENGLRCLQLYGTGFDSAASIVENFRPGNAVSCVKVAPVFSFPTVEQAAGCPALGVVKIDVEGSEAEILGSMRAMLLRDKPWVIVEILPCYGEDNAGRIERQHAIEALLDDIGYAKLRILRSPDGHLQRLRHLVSIGVHGDLTWCDYVLCPSEDIAKLARLVPIEDEGKLARRPESVC